MKQYTLRMTILSTLVLAAILCLNACNACTSASLEGTYTDASGALKLELQSGGKATWTALNSSTACTYKVDGKQVTVQCENQTLPFTVQSDGSLMPPQETNAMAMGPLKKVKP